MRFILLAVLVLFPSMSHAETAPTVGHVVEQHTDDGTVIVDLGSQQGVKEGAHITFMNEHSVQLAGGDSGIVKHSTIAVGIVTAVSEQHAEVRLGINERVPVSSIARISTDRATHNKWLPPRIDDVWEIAFTLRPFLALDALGGGTLSDASIGYRSHDHWHVMAILEPLAGAASNKRNIAAVAGTVFAGFDTRFFEVGMGAGWSTLNTDTSYTFHADGSTTSHDTKSGFALAQLARLGAEDGVHLMVRNQFILYRSAFHYGGSVVQAQLPLWHSAWIFGRGGGGVAGYAYGEVGLRVLVRGNGDRNSWFLRASIGGAGVSRDIPTDCGPGDPCYTNRSYSGPMVGLGVETRF